MGAVKRSVCGNSWVRYLDIPSFQGRIDHLLRINFLWRFHDRPTPHNEGPGESNSKPFLDANYEIRVSFCT